MGVWKPGTQRCIGCAEVLLLVGEGIGENPEQELQDDDVLALCVYTILQTVEKA